MKSTEQLRQAVLARLDSLNPRERKLVTWGAGLALLALVWSVLIEPAWVTLRTAPGLEQAATQKVAAVMSAADELDALRGARARIQVREQDLEPRLNQLLIDQNLQSQAVLIRTEEGEFRVEFTEAPAVGLLAWLGRAEAITSLRLNQMNVQKVGPGVMTGVVVFVPTAAAKTGPNP